MSNAESATTVRATGVDAIYYGVRDVARARAFYRAILDIAEVSFETDHAVEYVLRDGTAFGFGNPGHAEWKASGCILFAVPDAEAAARAIPELGGKLDGEVRTFPNCKAQWCEDPDGNTFVLHQRI